MTKSYHELIRYSDFLDRFHYLQCHNIVGRPTFGSERWMNQRFYTSEEWKHVRRLVIERDDGCDLGCRDRPIKGRIMIHHINPLTPEVIEHGDNMILDLDNLISCSLSTHNDLHFGNDSRAKPLVERKPNDTCPWR